MKNSIQKCITTDVVLTRSFKMRQRWWKEKKDELERGGLTLRLGEHGSARDHPTEVLFPEILSLIFLYVCDPAEHSKTSCRAPLMLGKVCSRWRDIAHLTPHLWSFLHLIIRTPKPESSILELLWLYIRNVKSVPFTLHINFRAHNSTKRDLDPLLQTLHENTRTIRCLKLYPINFPMYTWFSNLSHVESLDIVLAWTHPHQQTDLSLVDFPCLHHARVTSSGGRQIILPWMQITSLWLEDVCIGICLSLLVRCPNLVEFHCADPRPGPPDAVWHRAGIPISIQHLERFTWAYRPHPQYLDVFPYLRFPVLQSLIWYSPYSDFRATVDTDTGEITTLQMLITNLPPTLSRLEFHGVKLWPKPFIHDLFSHTSGVRQLHLSRCEGAFIMSILFSLVRRYLPGIQGAHLPSLQDVTILDPSAGRRNFSALEAQMADGISRLFSLLKREARNNISVQLASNNRWGGEMYKVCRNLRRSGFMFLVWADTEMTRLLETKVKEERLLRWGAPTDERALRWR